MVTWSHHGLTLSLLSCTATMLLKRDEIRSERRQQPSALPLPLAGEGWGGGAASEVDIAW